MAPVCSTSDKRRQFFLGKNERIKAVELYIYTTFNFLQQQLRITVSMKLTSVELHEGGNQLLDRQRVVLHHFREALSTRLYGRVGDEQHLHQLGDKVRVPDVVLTADEHHQEGDYVLHTGLI